MRSAEKWSHEHKCAPQVQLNVVEELVALFSEEDEVAIANGTDNGEDRVFMALFKDASTGSVGPRTIKIKRKIQAEDVLILIDSGSSHTFVSEKVASKLVGIQDLSVPITVQVANGGQLNCTSYIPSASWSVSGYQFRTDIRVIPLQQYDLIVSMDWL
jgi:hypothetical protein